MGRVEIGCGGGLGRTGTVLACMAILAGIAPDEAVRWVRDHYDPAAIETPEQEEWVLRKYVVDGTIATPMRSQVTLRTIWIIEGGQSPPRFVTAYPV